MAGLDEGTVDYRATYNGEDEEPEVFPGLFPNLLANGASGIAVGMATSIPPHNVAELADAAVHLIDNPAAEDGALLDFVGGPDFPTGGVLVDSARAIAQAYATGRGSFRLRARIEKVVEKGGGWHLLVTEIPYGVQKGRLIEAIAALIGDKKLPILADVRDESAEDLRIILEPRSRTVDAGLLEESLYKMTELEVRFPLNLNVLDKNRTPGVMSLKQALTAWLAFQIEVLLNRSNTRIGKIDERLELLDGFLVAFLNLDRVIQIIRTEDEPKQVMIAEFALERPAGGGDPQHAAAEFAQAGGDGDRQGAGGAGEGARGAGAAGREPGAAADPDQARPGGDEGEVRRRAADADRGGGGAVARHRLEPDDREGADHRDPVAARLDPGDARACRGGRGGQPEVPRGRRA